MRTLIALLVSAISFPAFSQPALIKFSELTFSSALEHKVLDDHFNNRKTDYFMLFMANGNAMNETQVEKSRQLFYAGLEQFKTEKFASRKNDRKVKAVFDYLNETYLKRNESTSNFENIFVDGSFNDLSASMVIGLALHHLNIPFVVKEEVYLYVLAYPEDEKIMLQPTVRQQIITMTQEFKEHYVKTLREQKVITAQEYNSTNVNTLFNKHFLGNLQNHTFQNLAALQYVREGLSMADAMQNLEASQKFEKAYYLMPVERTSYMLFSTFIQTFIKSEQRDENHAKLLAKISRFKRYGITADMVESDFLQVIQDHLFDHRDKAKLDAYYSVLDTMVIDNASLEKIRFAYHYQNGIILTKEAKYGEALPFFEKALTITPTHADATALLLKCAVNAMENKPNSERIVMLENISATFPLITENNFFNQILTTTYLVEVQNRFEHGEQVLGEKYKQLFEKYIEDHKDIPFSRQLVGQAYGSAAIHYYKKGQTTKAKSIVSRGLEISPENYDLRMSLRMMD